MGSLWQDYLPRYRLPAFWRHCLGCLTLFALLVAVLIFGVLPLVFHYLGSLQVETIFDVPVQGTLAVGGCSLTVLAVDDGGGGGGGERQIVTLRNEADGATYTVEYVADDDAPPPNRLHLAGGCVVDVLRVSADRQVVRLRVQPSK